MRRRGVVVAALTLLGSPWASVPSRAATGMEVECTSNVVSSFPPQPGDAEHHSKVTVVDIYDPCTSTDATLKSGRRHLGPSQMDSCNAPAAATPGRDEIVWNNGNVSTWEYTRDATESNGSATVHQRGKITAGEFTGDTADEDLTVVLPGAYVFAGALRVPPRRQLGGDGGDRGADPCTVAQGQEKSATGRLQIRRS